MATTIDVRCGSGGSAATDGCGSSLPYSPFYAPRYHFGMLLGVDDFETEQAYHRGKMRLHNAWLHGEGVVWGFRVDAPALAEGGALRGELRVAPGLALDGAGRELGLEGPACVSVPAWFEAHRDDPDFRDFFEVAEDGTVRFGGYVSACFRACLARQVPAISEPCAGATGDTAYSRARETVELRLVPGPLPERTYPYHRLRLLFGVDEPATDDGEVVADDQAVLDARAAVLALDADARPAGWLAAFRRFAALDGMELAPAATPEVGEATLFPEPDDTCVVLARVELELRPGGGSYTLTGAVVENEVRRSHVATSTIQELLGGPFAGALAAPAAPSAPAPEPAAPAEPDEPEPDEPEPDEPEPDEPEEPEGEEALAPRTGGRVLAPRDGVAAERGRGLDAGGPRIDPGSVRVEGETVTLAATSRVSKASVGESSFSVTAFDRNDGWHVVPIRRAGVDRTGKRIRLDLANGPGGNLVRIIARGTGPTPLLGSDGVPLAGAVGGPPGGTEDGHDFVLMLKRSET